MKHRTNTMVMLGVWALLTGCASETDAPIVEASNNGDIGILSDVISDAEEEAAWPSWPAAGTSAIPVFGACRFSGGEVFAVPANGAPDDQLTLSTTANGGGVLSLVVSDGVSVKLEATDLEAKRGVRNISFRQLYGEATWGAMRGKVVDGVLCFEEELWPGSDVRAEFSLKFENEDKDVFSTGGSFLLSGDAISNEGAISILAEGLDIGLE